MALKKRGTKEKVKKKQSLPAGAPLSPEVAEAVKRFIDAVPPARLRKELLCVFLIFLEHEHETLPVNFTQVVSDYYMLFALLDDLAIDNLVIR